MLYHFCDDRFGSEFERRSLDLARHGGISVTFVHSDAPRRRPAAQIRRGARLLVNRLREPRIRRLYVRDINSAEFLRKVKPGDHGVVTGFNQIFSREAINKFTSLVNVHPSLLPYYRGPDPTRWCIEQGETATGFTIHRITERIDAGPILYQQVVGMNGALDALGLALEIARQAAPVFVRYVQAITNREQWQTVTVNAAEVYRNPLGYCRRARRERVAI